MPDFSLLDSRLEDKIVKLSQEQVEGGFKQVRSNEIKEKLPKGVSIEVHVYSGSSGEGYIVVSKTTLNKKNYIKQVDFGAEKRTFEWREILPLN